VSAVVAEVVTGEAGLAALWKEWEMLWRRVPGALPFLSPAWLEPWWRTFGSGAPAVAVLRRGEEPVGILPLYRLEQKLLPMGVGISDYFDVLLAPGLPPDAADLLLAAALGAGGAPRCDLPELVSGARLRTVSPPSGWREEAWGGPPCPVLRLHPQPEIPKGMQRDLRQARNRAKRRGGWEIVRAGDADPTPLLEVLVRLHGARWRARGKPGVLADCHVLGFHQHAAPALLRADLLRLEAVRLRGAVAAVIYALLGKERIYFYLSGFDSAFSFESPGTILLGHMIEQAAREGRHEAHFLRGGEAYKYAWGGVDRFNAGRSFVRA